MWFAVSDRNRLQQAAQHRGLAKLTTPPQLNRYGSTIEQIEPIIATLVTSTEPLDAYRAPKSPAYLWPPHDLAVYQAKLEEPGVLVAWDEHRGGYGLEDRIGHAGQRLLEEYASMWADWVCARLNINATDPKDEYTTMSVRRDNALTIVIQSNSDAKLNYRIGIAAEPVGVAATFAQYGGDNNNHLYRMARELAEQELFFRADLHTDSIRPIVAAQQQLGKS